MASIDADCSSAVAAFVAAEVDSKAFRELADLRDNAVDGINDLVNEAACLLHNPGVFFRPLHPIVNAHDGLPVSPACPITSMMLAVKFADCSASFRTSSATTAKPRPCSRPELSIAALRASRLVCSAISVITSTIPNPLRLLAQTVHGPCHAADHFRSSSELATAAPLLYYRDVASKIWLASSPSPGSCPSTAEQ